MDEVTDNIKEYQTLNVVFCRYRFYFGLKGSRTLNVYFDILYRELINEKNQLSLAFCQYEITESLLCLCKLFLLVISRVLSSSDLLEMCT